MELLVSSLFFTIFFIWLVDYVENRISDIKMWWEHKQYAKKKKGKNKMTDKIKLGKTWFKSNMVITYLSDGRINYWARNSDYANLPKDLSETATEYSYIKPNLEDYSKSKHHTVNIKRYYEKDYE